MASPLKEVYNIHDQESVVDQSLYYPTATSYGYISTGFESPGDLENTQFTGATNQSLPYVYYTPSYGYVQSPYNPYNPYIPGAIIGVDGSYVAQQNYYHLPSYENPVSSSAQAKGLSANRPYNFVPRNHAKDSVHKFNRVPEDVKVNSVLTEHNRGPRTNKSKNQLVVRAFTTRAGNPDAKGNITIYTDQYNKSDFPVDYMKAKFFVIKSYSEDDVHKSVKYNVWSSTHNGNKKLNLAYEDAQKIDAGDSKGCPIFLFFSVNASGQFCGVAEMTGPVDFDKDMDFWQQDKWSGSFHVKWHIIKDLPNSSFRDIILENNENKPVTNSRDTQEIGYKKGLEMLQIYHNYTSKTSLLDDFTYYENRQQILHEERIKPRFKNYQNPYIVPLADPTKSFHDFPSVGSANNKNTGSTDDESNGADGLKFGSLTIDSSKPDSDASCIRANSDIVDVVTIGSMPVKVNGSESIGFLTVGSIPLDARTLQSD